MASYRERCEPGVETNCSDPKDQPALLEKLEAYPGTSIKLGKMSREGKNFSGGIMAKLG